jgi:hypothetical protein
MACVDSLSKDYMGVMDRRRIHQRAGTAKASFPSSRRVASASAVAPSPSNPWVASRNALCASSSGFERHVLSLALLGQLSELISPHL